MRDVRRLPPFLRGVSILGLLFSFAALVLIATQVVMFILGGDVVRQELANDPRLFTIAVNLTMLSLACTFTGHRYRTHVRQSNQEQVPLDSWPRQARAIALMWALPLCAIAVAALLPPTQDAAVMMVYVFSLIGAGVLAIAFARLEARG